MNSGVSDTTQFRGCVLICLRSTYTLRQLVGSVLHLNVGSLSVHIELTHIQALP